MIRARFLDVDMVTWARSTVRSGGFNIGLAEGTDFYDADLLWVMNGDAIPVEAAMAESRVSCDVSGPGRGLVVERVARAGRYPQLRSVLRDIDWVSNANRCAACVVVGRQVRIAPLLIEASAIRGFGAPIADFFIRNDDVEFIARIVRRPRGGSTSTFVAIQKAAGLGISLVGLGERLCHAVRDRLCAAGEVFAPAEKGKRVGSAVRSWVLCYHRCHNRGAMRPRLKDCLRDGLKMRPGPMLVVLAQVGSVLAPRW